MDKENKNNLLVVEDLSFKKLYDEAHLLNIVKRMASEINSFYAPLFEENSNEKVIIVSVLKGAFMFTSDLFKELSFPAYI